MFVKVQQVCMVLQKTPYLPNLHVREALADSAYMHDEPNSYE